MVEARGEKIVRMDTENAAMAALLPVLSALGYEARAAPEFRRPDLDGWMELFIG